MFGFENPQGLISEGLWEIKTHSYSTHAKSHMLQDPRAEAVISKEPGSDSPADLGESPGVAGGSWSSP